MFLFIQAEALRAATLRWTTALPTQAGFYWHRHRGLTLDVLELLMESLNDDPEVLYAPAEMATPEDLGGEWSDQPIPVPGEALAAKWRPGERE